MSDSSRIEKTRAAQEAREAVASRPPGSSGAAIEAAMLRYLSAQEYHELAGESGPGDETGTVGDDDDRV